MEKELIISIIVPIYNAEKFIDRLASSIACQLTEELELILVDDGSTDGSGELCDEWARRNSHIHIIHKENGGSSSARNVGILAARGEYISFVDADDYVDATTYQTLIDVIRNHHPDCIDFGWRYISRSGDTQCSSNKVPKDVLLGPDIIKSRIIPTLLNLNKDEGYFVYDFVWNKLYRREKIISYGVMFLETRRTWEDRPFLLHYLRYCETYYSLPDCFYNYVDVSNSKSRKFNVDRLRIIAENYCRNKKMFGNDYDFDAEYVNTYWAAALEKMILQSLEQSEQRKMITDAVRTVLQEKEVIHWFSKRTPGNSFERKVGALIVEGKIEKAIRYYEKKAVKNRRNLLMRDVKKRFKDSLRKIVRK